MLSRRTVKALTHGALFGDSGILCPSCLNRELRWFKSIDYKAIYHARSTSESRRASSSSSSQRWQSRQGRDSFSREARVQGLKSRAAFKLLEINEKYKILKKGQTVVDLGYAPGSWLQVAVDRTAPNGRVIGIDIIPAPPPKGASTIQGNFLSASVQAEVRRFLSDPGRGRVRRQRFFANEAEAEAAESLMSDEALEDSQRGYINHERHDTLDSPETQGGHDDAGAGQRQSTRAKEEAEGKTVDVVLSDMSAPWEQTTGFWKRSLSEPYSRMMNTSGLGFRDHAGSMDLCAAALRFCFDTLRTGGHFVCKFYQGAEDKAFETRLKGLFKTVHREKPESSRSASREAYFVALKRKGNVSAEDVFKDS